MKRCRLKSPEHPPLQIKHGWLSTHYLSSSTPAYPIHPRKACTPSIPLQHSLSHASQHPPSPENPLSTPHAYVPVRSPVGIPRLLSAGATGCYKVLIPDHIHRDCGWHRVPWAVSGTSAAYTPLVIYYGRITSLCHCTTTLSLPPTVLLFCCSVGRYA